MRFTALTWFIIFLFSGCNNEEKYSYLNARLENLATVDTTEIRMHSGVYDLKPGNERLIFHSKTSNASLEFKPQAVELPETWDWYTWLTVNYKNEGNDSIRILLKIYGSKNVIIDSSVLQPSGSSNIRISLLELPLANKRQNYYKVEKLSIESNSKIGTHAFSISSMSLVHNGDSIHKTVVDKFGQRLHAEWPKKVKSIGQLVESRINEEKELEAYHANPRLDSFGGTVDIISLKATGFFRLEETEIKSQKRWWLVTPDGNPFWSLGVTCIRPKYPRTAVTKVDGFEYLFKKLPNATGNESEAYIGDSLVSFYYWNLLRKYGTIGKWHDTMFKRMSNWGLNTIGNWSEKEILLKSDIPFTYSFRTTENEKFSFGHGMNDVFHPGWKAHVDKVFEEAAEFKDNPYLIGYFVDNEGGWGDLNLMDIMPPNCASRDAWENFIRKKYNTLTSVNNAWNSNLPDWDSLRNMKSLEESKSGIYLTDIVEFETLYAEEYFSTIKILLQKHDPNHLYLGCRFTKRLKPEHILKMAGNYCDVVTVNVYDLVPVNERMDKWHEYTGRPILIGEHHLPLQSNRQLPPHYRAFTSEERFKYYQEYVKTWANQPYSLGCHWYQLADQHITGRYSNGENQTIGLVDITDQPYPDLVKAIKISKMNMYNWHLDGE